MKEEELAKKLLELTGVKWVVISSEGFPVYYGGDVDSKRAEDIAALLEEGASRLGTYVSRLGGRAKTLSLETAEGEILVAEMNGLYFIVGLEEKAKTGVSAMLSFFSRGVSVKCSKCGADLTYEAYKCPGCGSLIPFILDKCPYCGRRVDVKKCPSCGALLRSDGSEYRPSMLPLKLAAGISGMVLSVSAVLSWFSGNPLSALLGIIGSSILMYLGYKDSMSI